MASTIKVTNINTPDGTGNITVDRPLSGSGASLTALPAASLTGTIADARFPATLPAISGTNLTNLDAADLVGALPALTLAGALTGADQTVSAINLKDYGETTNAIGGTGGGTQDIDLTLGNSVSATVDTSTNTFTFSNPTASDELCSFILFLTNGGSQTVNWPGTVDWEGGTAPTLTSSGVDVIAFSTINAGTLWHGFVISTDSK